MPARDPLPVHALGPRLLEALEQHNRIIIQAPTGSGKSTQIPQILLDGGVAERGQIVILQPRRLPARMLAARVADERGTELGGDIGYQVRFNDCSSRQTRIKFVTEGVLLRRMINDPALRGIDTVIFDEFHERHVETDITMALALRVQQERRPDLRLIVMSATLESDRLVGLLAPCQLLTSEGRTFPVQIQHLSKPLPEKTPLWEQCARECAHLIGRQPDGDVLIFMPGAYEIDRTVHTLRSLSECRHCDVLPLHGQLPEREQDRAVAPGTRRKLVVATNVAETSLTIDGVTVVIDSGLARVPRFDPHRGINSLLTEKISRASADQRAGRAGRTAPGLCLRLWTRSQHDERPAFTVPEILRVDLADVVLMLQAAGSRLGHVGSGNATADILALPWVDAPEHKSVQRAAGVLTDLGALAADGKVTSVGMTMSSFPTHPRFARMLLAADTLGCVSEAAMIAAMTQERNLLTRRAGSVAETNRDLILDAGGESDFFWMLEAFDFAARHDFELDECQRLGIHANSARQVARAYRQFAELAEREGLRLNVKAASKESVQKAILAGFSDEVARRVSLGSTRFRLVHGRAGTLARDSAVRQADLMVASEIRELVAGKGETDVVLSLCTAIREEWLQEMYPDDFSEVIETVYDDQVRRVFGQRVRKFRDLALETRSNAEPDMDKAATLLAREVMTGRVTLTHWGHEADQWLARVNLVAKAAPELGMTAIDEAEREAIIEQICHGCLGVKELKERPVMPVLKSWLSHEQRTAVEKLAPERVRLTNGKEPKVHYEGGRALISLRIQELYDVTTGVTVVMGRVPVVIQILGPNHRPVQITEDLSGFWRDLYPVVKKELQRKYPRHEWR